MFMNRKIKSVSFNLSDPFEKEIYEHSQQYPNFSSFIKRLIQNSLYGGKQQVQPQEIYVPKTINYPQDEIMSLNQDMMKQFL